MTLNPVPSYELQDVRWSRLAKRLESLLIAACPKSVKEELVAGRIKTPLGIICRLYSLYAPGGVSEREQGIQFLQSPVQASSPHQATEVLRKWKRWLLRTQALGGTTPDPVILVKALNTIVKGVLEGAPEALFRVNLVRAALKVEVAPSQESVVQLHAALTAEVEALGRVTPKAKAPPPQIAAVDNPTAPASSSQAPGPKGKGNPKNPAPGLPTVNPKSPPPQPGSTGNKCRFFLQGQGCRKGERCQDLHEWKEIPANERSERCMACGGRNHRKVDCPNSKAGRAGGPPPKNPKTSPPPKGPELKAAAPSPNANHVTALLEDAAKVLKAIQPKEPSGVPVVEAQPIPSASQAPVAQGVPVSVATLQAHLDAIRQAIPDGQPNIRTAQVASTDPSPCEVDQGERTGLLDSGASHPMRSREPKDTNTSRTEVTLAGGVTRVMEQNSSGTILVEPGSQPIVPVGALIQELGCSLTWSGKKATLVHPLHGKIPLRVRQGCPILAETRALELIHELEEAKLAKFNTEVEELQAILRGLSAPKPLKARVKEARETGSRVELLQAATATGLFAKEHLPLLGANLPIHSHHVRHVLKALQLPRRTRRTLESSKDWVLRFVRQDFGDDPLDTWCNQRGVPIVTINLSKQHREALTPGNSIAQILLWAAVHGRIAGVEGELGPNLSLVPLLQWLWTLSSVVRGYTVPLAVMSSSAKPFTTEAWNRFATWTGGLETREAPHTGTVIASNCAIPSLDSCKVEAEVRACIAGAFLPPSDVLRPGELESIDKAITEARRQIQEPSEAPAAAAVSKEEEEWRQHILSGHLPYRRDCKACILGSGVGLQHRKVKAPASFALSCDLLGPLPEKGLSEDCIASRPRHRYALVAAYRAPSELLEKGGWIGARKSIEDLFAKDLLDQMAKEGKDLRGIPPIPEHDVSPAEEDHRLEEEVQDVFSWPEEEEGAPEISSTLDTVTVEVEEEEEGGLWDEEALRTTVKQLESPVPQTVLRFVRPIPSKHFTAILPAIHSIISEIERIGLPVRSLHTDQGREFLSEGLKEWCSKRSIRVSMSEPHDHKGNGLAERIVGWSKQRARTLLSSADLPVIHWPSAMQYAASLHQHRVLGTSPPAYFGQRVLFKRPVLPGNLKPWNPWSQGRYLSPSNIVTDGHVVLNDEGKLVTVRNIRANPVDPEKEVLDMPGVAADFGSESKQDDIPSYVVPTEPSEERYQPPVRRVVGKTPGVRLGVEEPPPAPLSPEEIPRLDGTKSQPPRVVGKSPGVRIGVEEPPEVEPLPLPDSKGLEEPAHRVVGKSPGGRIGTEEPPEVDQPSPFAEGLRVRPDPLHLSTDPAEPPVPAPRRKITGKTKMAKRITVVQPLEEKARSLREALSFSPGEVATLLNEALNIRPSANHQRIRGVASGCTFGAYARGSINKGITLATGERPELTRYLNAFLQHSLGDCEHPSGTPPTWVALAVFRAREVSPHRDLQNEIGSWNHAVHVKCPTLWVESTQDSNPVFGGGKQEESEVKVTSERVLAGREVQFLEGAVTFNARNWHAVPASSDWVIAGFTPLGWDRDLSDALRGFGFPVPSPVRIAMIQGGGTSSSSGELASDLQGDSAATSGISGTGSTQASIQVSSLGSTPEEGIELPDRLGAINDPDLVRALVTLNLQHRVEGLEALGVEVARDMLYVYPEDLLEEGWSLVETRLFRELVLRNLEQGPTTDARPSGPTPATPAQAGVRAIGGNGSRPTFIQEIRQRRHQRAAEERASNVSDDATAGSSEPPEGRPDPRVTPAIIEAPAQEAFDEIQQWTPIPLEVLRLAEELGSEADLVARPSDIEYANNTFDDMVRGYFWNRNGLHPIVARLALRTFARHRCDVLGLSDRHPDEEAQEESTLETPVIRMALHDHEDLEEPPLANAHSSCSSRIPAALLSPAYIILQQGVQFPKEVDQVPHVSEVQACKAELYTHDMEGRLEALQGRPLETTHTVAPAEVRRHKHHWFQAFKKELESLVGKGAIERVSGKRAAELLNDPESTVLHAKGVCTVKPGKQDEPYRRKARLVACGNESGFTDADDLYASGVAVEGLRAALVEASHNQWGAYGTDVATAFLLAPLGSQAKGRKYILRPPQILRDLALAEEGEYWVIRKAIYGLRESPRWWSEYRDQALKGVKTVDPTTGELLTLEQGQVDANILRIKGVGGETLGLMILYVDDVLFLTTESRARAIYDYIRTSLGWELDPLKQATEEEPLKFLGVNIRPLPKAPGKEPGFSLEQTAYIEEVLHAHGFSGHPSLVACPKELLHDFPNEPAGADALKRAQKITGELLWISQRSRPDISYLVHTMCCNTSKCPERVCEIGQRLLKFLAATKNVRLELRVSDPHGGVQVFTDASFAPEGAHSFGGVLIKYRGATVFWKATKLPLISVSTAEAELQTLSEGAILGQSFLASLQDVTNDMSPLHLRCDSTAAIALAEGSSSQRTRHLKVRAAALRQLVEQGMSLSHCPGDIQCADILTKALSSARLRDLSILIGLTRESEEPTASVQCLQGSGCSQGLAAWVALLMSYAGVIYGQEQHEGQAPPPPPPLVHEDPPGVSDDTWLYVALVVVVIAALGVWECLKGVGRGVYRRVETRPVVKALSRREEKLQRAVAQALERELPSPDTSSTTSIEMQARRRHRRKQTPPPPPPCDSPQGSACASGDNPWLRAPVPRPPPPHPLPPTPARPAEGTSPVRHAGVERGVRGVSVAVQTEPVLVFGVDEHAYMTPKGKTIHDDIHCRAGLHQPLGVTAKTPCRHCLGRKTRNG